MKLLHKQLILLVVAVGSACSLPAFADGLRPTHAQKAMVVSIHPEASQAGVEILR